MPDLCGKSHRGGTIRVILRKTHNRIKKTSFTAFTIHICPTVNTPHNQAELYSKPKENDHQSIHVGNQQKEQ